MLRLWLRENIRLIFNTNPTLALLNKGLLAMNVGVFDFLIKMDLLGVLDTFPAEALLHSFNRLM